MKKSQSVAGKIFPILREPATAIEPSYCAFDDPAFRQDDKTLGLMATPDDLDFELRQKLNQRVVEDGAAVGRIGKKLFEKREHAEQRR
jgi:hypothetical protein